MGIELTALHWSYMVFIVVILAAMLVRRDTTLICIVGISWIGYLAKDSVYLALIGIFNSFVYAINELLGTILVISLIVAMSRVLLYTGVNEIMVKPFTTMINTPAKAYWIIGIFMMVISLFFWPSPAAALMGAVLLPIGLKVGLPAIGVAIAINLFGHGIALSGDYIIQGAPKLTADAAGIPVESVMIASVPLVVIMGMVTTIIAFWLLMRDIKRGNLKVESTAIDSNIDNGNISRSIKNILAILVPVLFLLDVILMIIADLKGGDSTALIGSTAILILVIMALTAHKNKGLEEITAYLIEGFKFGFTVFGPVIPIAAFFYLGDSGFTAIFGKVLPIGSEGIVNDLGLALARTVPLNASIGAVTLTVVGAITGLDGSGFSGISLVGSLAKIFSLAIGSGIATLTAIGQIAAIWVGGGTLVPWSLIAASAICGVDPFEVARRNFLPVIIGLLVTTIVGMFLI